MRVDSLALREREREREGRRERKTRSDLLPRSFAILFVSRTEESLSASRASARAKGEEGRRDDSGFSTCNACSHLTVQK